MQNHKIIMEHKNEIANDVYERLLPEVMRIVNDVTNSNTALQEKIKGMNCVFIQKWNVKCRWMFSLVAFMCAMLLFWSFELNANRKQNDVIIQERNFLLHDSKKLLEKESEIIDEIILTLEKIKEKENE